MDLLQSLNKFGWDCPVCDDPLSYHLLVNGIKINSYYTLTNREYPLLFRRTISFDETMLNDISIDENNILVLPYNYRSISCGGECKKHYKASIFTSHSTSTQCYLDIKNYLTFNYEVVLIGDYRISNLYFDNKTLISQSRNKIGYWSDTYINRFSVDLQPLSFWSVSDPEKCLLKIEKYVLLT
jgi:hypothetical protein